MSSRTSGNTCGDCVFFGRRTGIVRTRNVCERPGAKCRAVERDEHACGSYQASPRTSFGLGISRASRAVTAAKAPVPQPRPAPGRQILCDTHCHTLFSRHAYSTLEEDVRAAAAQGMELLGITDHYSSMLYARQSVQDWQYFLNLWAWPRRWHGVRLLRGCEADIVDLDGNIFGHDIFFDESMTGGRFSRPHNLKRMAFAQCDYVIASVHGKEFAHGASRNQITRMYLRVLEDPKVLILGHIGRTGLDFDMDAVLGAAKERGKLIEVNESSLIAQKRAGSYERCRQVVSRCAELGVSVSVGSDAHVSSLVGHHEAVDALLDEVHFPQELVACRDAATFAGVVESVIGPMAE